MSNGTLPSYVSMAKPNPPTNRAPWYKNTAPTYAGIFLWFVFWSQAPSGGSGIAGGVLSQGVGTALLGLVIAALLCHFLFYLVPGLLGLKTGLPLYVVGTSTYGTQGGFLMPGFLMGVLQFGWLGVNAYFSAQALSPLVGDSAVAVKILAILWAALGRLRRAQGHSVCGEGGHLPAPDTAGHPGDPAGQDARRDRQFRRCRSWSRPVYAQRGRRAAGSISSASWP